MASIRILPEILSNQIAAGEVVERPASVVKELLENAIDAQSDRIHVEIEQGGRSLIRVADNGTGMSHDDALLALERYATSKIRDAADLSNILSLGFRGEALPSIAAVSKFSMVTRDAASDAGTEILVEGGKIRSVNWTGAPQGTMITARQLFFNTPARRKFLKTVNTEMGHITETVACIALSRPGIRFRLVHNRKPVKDWPGTQDPFERVVDVLGSELQNLLYPVHYQNRSAGVSGWIADPSATRSGTSRIYIFVNGRFVRDRSIIYALSEGYRGRLIKGRFPIAVLFLDVPAPEVDVNVHPAKQEIRFMKQREVVEAVRLAAEGAWQHRRGQPPPHAAFRPPAPEAKDLISEPVPGFSPAGDRGGEPRSEKPPAGGRKPPPAQTQAPLFAPGFFSGATVIGQFRNTYIICETGDELILVDQHAAHERVVYERLCRARKSGRPLQAQRLLVPETVDLGYGEVPAMERMLPELHAMGFEIEFFGGETFVVKAVPGILGGRKISPLITDIAEAAERLGGAPDVSGLVDQCIVLAACHGAIRANQRLSENEMTSLLRQLDECENPFNCPHGRPTVIRWPVPFLEKRFGRTP